jgi:hypothetical protein
MDLDVRLVEDIDKLSAITKEGLSDSRFLSVVSHNERGLFPTILSQ